jgi:poly-beta-1,6-N-acetyl-D-glucosamine synthase
MRVSVGVCAHNEEGNILQCLRSISSQPPNDFQLMEIVVVSSASTDATDELVRSYMRGDSRIKLLVQERREGKSSAVNLFMESANGDILVLVNADNILGDGSLRHLLEPFKDERIGMVGGHPVPVNERDSLSGFAVHMLWEMHHRLSMISPKTGELIAFRNLGLRIPKGVNTDEDWIRMELERKGFLIEYAPDATVRNRGPENLEDLWIQRTRVNIGERYMRKKFDFRVPTWNPRFLISSMKGFLKDHLDQLPKVAGSILI